MSVNNILSHQRLQFLFGLVPGLSLSVGIIAYIWFYKVLTPDSLMMMYIVTTVFFSIIATVVRLRFKLNFAAGALYVVSFLWFFSYSAQRIIGFDFFTDYRYKAAYQEKKDAFRPEVALALLYEGDGALSNNNLREAKLKYHTALHFDTSNADVYFALGNIYMRVGSSDTALTFFHEGLKRRFENPLVHNFVGVLSAKNEDYETAVKALQTAIMQDTSFHLPKDNLASVLRKKEIYDQAIKAGMMRVRQIVVETKDEARDIKRQINKGGDFALLARTLSKGDRSPFGGLTEFFPPNQPGFTLAEITKKLKIGEVSDIIEYAGMYIIVKRIN